ncbi:MAG: hypothetical protein KTR19_10130 [Hyphomicrobiales bacterium]|nr:hypothetical protein [Hyphomicrobiales bacterium]
MTIPLGKFIEPKPSAFSTPFRTLYDAIWEAETRFDLLFRREKGPVHVWAANRVRFYYELAQKLGIYTPQQQHTPAAQEHASLKLNSLFPVDAYIQTGALGLAAANRMRPYGCIYTEQYVRRLLEKGRGILLVHDQPEALVQHPRLQVITSRQLASLRSEAKDRLPKLRDVRIDKASADYWAEVDAFFRERLGLPLLDQARVEQLILQHRQALTVNEMLFGRIQPKCFILMTHYFRAPQIEAAQKAGVRVIDYQHGINSRYHLGYGFPHLQPTHRKIPYFPDEFWSWGDLWTDTDWFPHACCDPRPLGHYQAGDLTSQTYRQPAFQRTLLLATSWAMQKQFRGVARRLAELLSDWHILIKLHPRESEDAYADIAESFPNVSVVAGTTDIFETSRSADIVASICSSALFDVLMNGCKVIVINAPSVEYAEDFVQRFDVPILQPDASNIRDCIARCGTQNIRLDKVFAQPNDDYLDIALDSITSPSPHNTFRLPPTTAPVSTRLNGRLQRYAKSLSFGGFAAAAKRLSMPARRNQSLSHENAEASEAFRNETLIALKAAMEAQDSGRIGQLIIDLVRSGTTSRKYRTSFISAMWAVEQDSKRAARALLRGYIAVIPQHELAYNLPLYEHAVRLGVGSRFADRFNIRLRSHSRIWRSASALFAQTSHIAGRMCETVETLAASCDAEWLDSRVSQKDQRGLFMNLKQRLNAGEPFAMIRLGDGEVYGFSPDYVKETSLSHDRELRELVWWGSAQDASLRNRLCSEFISSLQSADYLGVPSPFRLLRDIPSSLADLRRPIDNWHRTVRAHFVLLTELSRLHRSGELDMARRQLVDERCHQPLFTQSLTRELLAERSHSVCISCFSKKQLNAALGIELFHDQVLLPPHQKVLDLVEESEIRTIPAPELIDTLYEQIDQVVRPGSTVLVAGGFVGKLLIARARAAGGMVLDIGASADYWIGRETRGKYDFSDYRRERTHTASSGQPSMGVTDAL